MKLNNGTQIAKLSVRGKVNNYPYARKPKMANKKGKSVACGGLESPLISLLIRVHLILRILRVKSKRST